MAFQWPRFLNSHGIQWVDKGPSVTAGNIAIHCPFCGPSDAGHHMSLSLEGQGWRCWRRPDDHKGRSPVHLIATLLGCSHEEAARIAGVRSAPPAGNFLETITGMLTPPAKPSPPASLTMPPDFKPLSNNAPAIFRNYMASRGYENLDYLAKLYDLRYATSGPYKGRIVFPVVTHGQIRTWTGRTVYPSVDLRYRALSADPEKAAFSNLPAAHGPISDYLLWYDRLMKGGNTLILTEGPFDALRIERLVKQLPIRATCFFGIRPSEAQVDALHDVAPRFRRRIILSDIDALGQGYTTRARLASLGVECLPLPTGVKDPAMLDEQGFWRLVA